MFLTLAKNSWKKKFCRSALFHMKTRVSLKYFVNDCGSSHYFFSCKISQREIQSWIYNYVVVESKESPFHRFASNFPNRIKILFGKSYIWNLLCRCCPATRMGVPGTCYSDVTKAVTILYLENYLSYGVGA